MSVQLTALFSFLIKESKIIETGKFEIKNFIYSIGIVPVFLFYFIQSSMFNTALTKRMLLVSFVWMCICLLGKVVFLDSFTAVEWFTFIIFISVTAVACVTPRNFQLFIFVLSILASKGVKPRPLVWGYMLIGIGLLLIILYCAKIGVIPDLTYLRDAKIRHSFGIVYPTDFASRIFYFCCGYIYLRNNKKGKIFDFLLLLLVAFWVYQTTDARLNSGLIVLLAVSYLFLNKVSKVILKINFLIPLICDVFVIWGSLFFNPNNRVMSALNGLLSGRFSIVNTIYHQYGLHFLGQKIIETGLGGAGASTLRSIYGYTYIDSVYMRILLIFGLLVTVIIIPLLMYLLKRVLNPTLGIILMCIMLSGIVEQHFIDISYNIFFIVAAAQFLFKKNNKKV